MTTAQPTTGERRMRAPQRAAGPGRHWRISLIIILAAAATLRLAVASRDLDLVDRMFVPDDAYYTLAIARSIAEGRGATVDGVTPTSGFQPLLAFLVAPAFRVWGGPDAPIRFTLVLLALCDVAAAYFLALLARRLAGPWAGLVAATLWALSPVAIANALNGLETSLALALTLAVVEAWCRAREVARPGAFAAVGVLCGLALLARIDSAFLVGALGLLELLRGRVRGVAVAAGTALVVVAPWWGYCLLTFGSPVPESGAAVMEVVASHQRLYLTVPQQMAWAAGAVLGPPFHELAALQDGLAAHPSMAVAAWCTALGLIVAGAVLVAKRDERQPILALGIHAGLTLAFYTFLVPALWFFRRYLASVDVFACLVLSIAVTRLWSSRGRWPALRRGATVAFVVALTFAAATSAGYVLRTPEQTPDVGLHGAKGYREAVRDILALLPPDATVASLQSGALAYYAPPSVTVVNLDGVVDGRALRAVKDRRLSDYARERDVGYLADWSFNLGQFVRLSDRARAPLPKLQLVGAARPQGADRFQVVRLLPGP